MILTQPLTNNTGGVISMYESTETLKGGSKSFTNKLKKKSSRKTAKQFTRINKKNASKRNASKKHKCNKHKLFTDKYKMNPTFKL
jgi:hypothetical protein